MEVSTNKSTDKGAPMAEKEKKIRITTILGSVRPGNFTSKALAVVESALLRDERVELTTLDPGKYNLTFPGIPPKNDDATSMKRIIENADGIIIATPEYHGLFSSVIKLVIENLGHPSALKSKPVTLLGVASGQIGAIKSLEALRSVCSHVGALVLPGPVSVSNVQKMFDEAGNCTDQGLKHRLEALGGHLLEYLECRLCPKTALEAEVREKAEVS